MFKYRVPLWRDEGEGKMKQQLHRPPTDVKMKKAFTLIELLVVISIVAVLTVIILPNFKNAEKQFALQSSAHEIAQDIKKAQVMAISSKTFNGIIPSGGYGIYFPIQQNYVILFADCGNYGQYDSGGNSCNGVSETVEQLYLKKNIYINNVSGEPQGQGCVDSNSNGWTIFTAPDPKVYLAIGASRECSIINVVICLSPDCVKTKTVTINKGGLIDIK